MPGDDDGIDQVDALFDEARRKRARRRARGDSR